MKTQCICPDLWKEGEKRVGKTCSVFKNEGKNVPVIYFFQFQRHFIHLQFRFSLVSWSCIQNQWYKSDSIFYLYFKLWIAFCFRIVLFVSSPPNSLTGTSPAFKSWYCWTGACQGIFQDFQVLGWSPKHQWFVGLLGVSSSERLTFDICKINISSIFEITQIT